MSTVCDRPFTFCSTWLIDGHSLLGLASNRSAAGRWDQHYSGEAAVPAGKRQATTAERFSPVHAWFAAWPVRLARNSIPRRDEGACLKIVRLYLWHLVHGHLRNLK